MYMVKSPSQYSEVLITSWSLLAPSFINSASPVQDYVQAVTGVCYDGLEGLIYLVFFSFVTALMFSSIVCSVPHTWQPRR